MVRNRLQRYTRLLPVILAMSSAVLPVFLIGALFPRLRADIGVTATDVGLAGLVMFGTSAILTRPLAGQVERLGAARVLMIAGALSGAALLVVAWAQSPVGVMIAALVAGVGNALAHPAGNAYLASRTWTGVSGTIFGIKQSAVPAATLLCGLMVPVTLSFLAWRYAVGGLALMVLALNFAMYRWVLERGPVKTRAGALAGSAILARASANRRMGRVRLALITISAAAGMAASTSIGIFYVDTGVTYGIDSTSVGLMLSSMSVCGILARVILGWLVDRSASRNGSGYVMSCFAAGVLGSVALATGSPWMFFIGGLLAYSFGWAWSGLVQLMVVRGSGFRVAANSAVLLTGTSTGAALGPLTISVLATHSSLAGAWLASAAFAALAGVLFLLSLLTPGGKIL